MQLIGRLVVELDEDASEFRDRTDWVGDAGIGLDVLRASSVLTHKSLGGRGGDFIGICIGCNGNDFGGTGGGKPC